MNQRLSYEDAYLRSTSLVHQEPDRTASSRGRRVASRQSTNMFAWRPEPRAGALSVNGLRAPAPPRPSLSLTLVMVPHEIYTCRQWVGKKLHRPALGVSSR